VDISIITSLIQEDLRAVDAVIRKRLHSDIALVGQIAEYIIGSGGKRMRPVVHLLGAHALGHCTGQAHLMAAVVEFIHTATLLHDDVVDESTLRRGRETANAAFGNAASVLVGDFLYSRAFQMMVDVGCDRVMPVMADATNIIAEGEVMQLMNCGNADIDIDNYLDVIRRKTAKLFEASGRLSAIISGQNSCIEKALSDYGMHLGTAFQLVDDVLDYSGDETQTGKHLGDDLAEGKPTLPLLHVLRHGNAEQSSCVRKAITDGDRSCIDRVVSALRATGALEAARLQAKREAQAAQASLAPVPASIFKDALIDCATFAHSRNH
jgi:octaprenyl-diphosphate synthase